MSRSEIKEPIRIGWSIKWKLMLIMTLLVVGLMLILTYVQISSQKAVLEGELEKRITLMRENLIERGKSFITTLVQQVENDIAAFNFSDLMQAINEGVEYNEEIKYALLVDTSSIVYIHTLQPELVQEELHSERNQQALGQKEVTVFEYQEADGAVIEIVSPIQISTEPWGVLRLVYTLKQLQEEISFSQTQISRQINKIVYNSILTSAGFIVVAFLLVFLLSTRFSKPLIQLTQAARNLSKGDFAISTELRSNTKDEIGVLANSFIEMSQELKISYEKLEEYSRTLEQKVEERTKELHESLHKVEQANNKIMQSIQYARLIQYALLPNQKEVQNRLPHSFFLWMPRDVVGGDMFFMEFLEDSFILAVIDCTGHGVPGAFMTMLASSALTRIIRDDGCTDPGEILKRLNFTIKTLLHQNQTSRFSDNGLDAAICFVQPKDQTLVFSGAKLSLFFIRNGDVHVVKGDKYSIGYQRSDLNFSFKNHPITIEKNMTFYLSTDGYIDQLGGTKNSRFGHKRFKNLLRDTSDKSFGQQQDILLQVFNEYKGRNERQDDVTVVGFGFKNI